jgi:translation initiation factor IF-2
LSKRLFEIAKELNVDSKAIVAKCRAEDIPESVVKNHMSPISAGLEATIREWFSGQGGTSIETGEKVDLEKVKMRRGGTRAKAKRADGGSEDAATAVLDAPATPAGPATSTPNTTTGAGAPSHAAAAPPAAPTQPTTAPDAHRARAVRTEAAPATSAPATGASPPPVRGTSATVRPSLVVETPASHAEADRSESPREAVRPAASVATPAAPAAPKATPVAPSIPPAPVPAPTARPAADRSGPGGPGHAPGHAPGHTPIHGPGHTQGGHRPPPPPPPGPTRVAPAPMNVPMRPNVVAPAGPKLEVKTPVRLSGPKIVRVEAPEQVQAPRPRRVGPGGPPSGPRPGGGAARSDDDRGRSPRRSEATPRRSTGAGVPERRRGRSDADWSGTPGGVFSEQDLLEREARLARAGGFLKKRKQELSRPGAHGQAIEETEGKIRIAAPFTIKELSAATGVKGADIVKKLFLQGIPATINSPIAPDKAIELMMDLDIELEVTEAKTAEETVSEKAVNREMKDLRPRGPVVTILGHVDHGKTSLLDKIRNANVAAGEAGGITQKTSAFVSEVEVDGEKRQIVFLDTPGHEAFTGMRARGAKITDVVVLVVSAPEGMMPQTVESINHAKAAGVPIVVALNKIDRPDATEPQIQKTLGQLAGAGVNVVEWGGDVESVRVSAVTGQGLPKLLETLDLQASVLELKADFGGPAQGTVIEAKMEEGRGAVANVLIQHGRLKVGDFVVMGRAFGKVRDITDDKGRRLKEATPPMPVQISGIDEVCDAGDKFYVTTSLKQAEEAADQRRQRERHTALAQPKLTLDSLFSQMQQSQPGGEGKETVVKEIKIVLKTDQQGTVDVLRSECEKIKTEEVKVRVLDAGVGGITESNVLLADASRAIIIGFNVIPSGKARQLAEAKGVEIRTYQVIYDIVEDLKKAAEGLLAPELREEVLGHAEVRAVFKISKVGSIAGCYVTDGVVQRDALVRVTRGGVVVEHDRKLAQLKRLKDDAKEVRSGVECGMKIDAYDDIKEGDVIECYKKIEVKRTL